MNASEIPPLLLLQWFLLLVTLVCVVWIHICTDGRKDAPINHGPTSEDTLLEVWNYNFYVWYCFLCDILHCDYIVTCTTTVLTSSPSKELEDFVGAKFYCQHALADSN